MKISEQHIHFIGIGGAGMLPLAVHCKKLGSVISGSDLSSESFAQLKDFGINAYQGLSELPADTTIVIYSSAVRADNPELQQAVSRKLFTYKRAEFLGMLTKESQAILVSGCHGKSTTSVMLADVFHRHPAFKASAIIGALANSVGSNYYAGNNECFIVEADEYDRSFLKMFPHDAVILNIDNDHLDIYGDMNGLISAFTDFAKLMHKDGILAYNADDINVLKIADSLNCKKVSFGFGAGTKYSAVNIEYKDFHTTADLLIDGQFAVKISYLYTGKHNLYNMLAAFAISVEKGITPTEFARLMLSFQGLKRRQELIFSGKYWLMDDYAHHSTELKSSLAAVRESYTGRIIALFQPHLFSRTKYQCQEFAKSFGCADLVLIAPIYPARELFDPTITSAMIKEAMSDSEKQKTTVFDSFDQLYAQLKTVVQPGDLVISLGAGEINKLLYRLKNDLTEGK